MRYCRPSECGQIYLFNALTASQEQRPQTIHSALWSQTQAGSQSLIIDLKVIASLAKSKNIVPAQLEFVDIAGLVRVQVKAKGSATSFWGIYVKLQLLRTFFDVSKVMR